MCGVTACALLFARDGLGALILLIAVPGRVLTTWVAKELIERPRPSADLLDFTSQPSTFSFPSGHAAGAFVLYGLIFYLATLHVQNALVRSAIQAVCVVLIIGAGLERTYVGHHWPSDVLGGYWHGVLIVSAAIAIHQLGRRLRLEVTSGHPLRLHVRRHSPEQALGRPHET
jgi:undecaprenyl-diphosphatase